MELIDRYLHAVRIWLPAEKREDILAELSEDLASQIEDRGNELGRPLTEDEIGEILKKRGHPRVVACHFLPQQYLIGPALFPIYRRVLKMVLLWMLPAVFLAIVGPVAALTSDQPAVALAHALLAFPQAAITALAVITIIFALLDHYQVREISIDRWDPLKLPRVPVEARMQVASALGSIAEMVMGLLAVSCWAYVAWSGPTWNVGDMQIALAPIWRTLAWPVLGLLLCGAFIGYFSLLQPSRWRLRAAVRLATSVAALVLTYVVVRAERLLEITSTNGASAADAMHRANYGLRIGLASLAAFILLDIALEIRRLMHGRAPKAAHGATVSPVA